MKYLLGLGTDDLPYIPIFTHIFTLIHAHKKSPLLEWTPLDWLELLTYFSQAQSYTFPSQNQVAVSTPCG